MKAHGDLALKPGTGARGKRAWVLGGMITSFVAPLSLQPSLQELILRVVGELGGDANMESFLILFAIKGKYIIQLYRCL